jgi:hypothetical protein
MVPLAWFHHREVFDMCESETSLYERFLALSQEYDLVSPDLLVIPSQKSIHEQDAGGSSSSSDSSEDEGEPQQTMIEHNQAPVEEGEAEEGNEHEELSVIEAAGQDIPAAEVPENGTDEEEAEPTKPAV